WEEWVGFFLRGVDEAANDSARTATRVVELREEHRAVLGAEGKAAANLLRLHDHLFMRPYTNISLVASALDVTTQGARMLVRRMVARGLLEETTGRSRNRVW